MQLIYQVPKTTYTKLRIVGGGGGGEGVHHVASSSL